MNQASDLLTDEASGCLHKALEPLGSSSSYVMRTYANGSIWPCTCPPAPFSRLASANGVLQRAHLIRLTDAGVVPKAFKTVVMTISRLPVSVVTELYDVWRGALLTFAALSASLNRGECDSLFSFVSQSSPDVGGSNSCQDSLFERRECRMRNISFHFVTLRFVWGITRVKANSSQTPDHALMVLRLW
ncbi:hypothetical protein KC361_g286 [Hortaea werneckii]|nr:hypothetical protein KC361_g286 [Hortaea werneckii]